MKDSQYITHDLGARNDPKLMDLQMEMGGQGLGIFWCLVEMLWENGGYIPANYRSIAFALRWCKPAEVEKVVNNFGLFQIEDGQIFSRSALERITHKRDTIEAKREGGRKGASRRWNSQRNEETNDKPDGIPNGAPIAEPMPINKLINKQTNKESNNNTPLTAADFFEIFFFGNVKDPGAEAHRFVNYYQERGWTYLDGTPVTDPSQAAVDWKPKLTGKRWDDEALRWYRAVWNAAANRTQDHDETLDTFLCQLTNMRRKDQQLALIFRTEGAARKVSSFILDNDLAGDYKLDFRVSN